MVERLSKVDVGTIGSSPCEVSLNQILIKHNDAKITRSVMSIHNKLRLALIALEPLLENRPFYRFYIRMTWEHFTETFKTREDKLPKEVFTHAMCCYKALYRRALKKLEGVR